MFESLNLTREPTDNSLRAWSAADELLVARYQDTLSESCLFINDPFGAATLSFSQIKPDLWQDSAMSREATERNLTKNGQPPPKWIDNEDQLHTYQTVVLWLPKSIPYFEFLLNLAKNLLAEDGTILILGMVKHIARGQINCMNLHFSSVNPGKAEKKARVIECKKPISTKTPPPNQYSVDFLDAPVVSLPGCYGANGLDAGARVVLNHLKDITIKGPALDMGCGNGILSLALLDQCPELDLVCVDEHRAALRSAQLNIRTRFPEAAVKYLHSNGLNAVPDQKFELIVCNPPFHQENVLTERISEKLFRDFSLALSHTGECWIIANRHLDYYKKLKSIFATVHRVSKDPKFVLYRCKL